MQKLGLHCSIRHKKKTWNKEYKCKIPKHC